MRRISQSEVTSWLTCRARYRYEFDMNLERVQQSDALNVGNLGHEALEHYYRALMDGAGHEDAVVEGRKVFMGALDTYGMEIIAKVDPLVIGYWDFYDSNEWEILAVEETFDLEITDEFTMPAKIDLMIRRRSDRKVGIVDHKFKGEFYLENSLALSGQMPKYIAALKDAGYPVEFGLINQIRTRKIKNPSTDQLFRRAIVTPSIDKTRNVLKQQYMASQEITEYRALTPGIRKQVATPVLNEIVCKYCNFSDLCSSELDGGEIEYLVANEYQQKKSYGYNNETESVMDKL